jgi:hypothetical protein
MSYSACFVHRSSLLMQGYEQTLGLTGEQGQFHLNIQTLPYFSNLTSVPRTVISRRHSALSLQKP